MRSTSNKLNLIKVSAIVIVFIFAVVGFLGFSTDYQKVGANASGPPPQHTNAPSEGNCTACHSDFPINSGSGNVLIAGVPANYELDQIYQITVTVNQGDGVIFGFQLTAVDKNGAEVGMFSLPNQTPAQTQIVDGFVDTNIRRYVEHTLSGTTPTEFGTKSWNFMWKAPSMDAGPIGFYAAGNAANSDGDTTGDQIYTTAQTTTFNAGGATPFDFDGDSKTDVSIFRPGPTPAQWWLLRSSDGGNNAYSFGLGTDRPVPGDFTGDGKTDLAFFRESTSEWFFLRSEDSTFFSFPFGASGDIAAPGDYDGDGIEDAGVFRPSTSTWFINNSTGGTRIETFGISEDKPVVDDYDGDGKDDIAIYRPSSSQWWLSQSSLGVKVYQFGQAGDKTVQGDFTGDGKADAAFWRPSNGEWFVIRSDDDSFFSFPFGTSGDIPVPGDYDGDGQQDAAVFRPTSTTWFINGSTSGTQILGFGLATDIPLANAFSVE